MMWKIFKGDLSYYKSGVFILYGTGMIFFVMAAVWNFFDIYIFSSTMIMVFWVVTAMMGVNEGTEKHIRIYSLLPVSVKDFARARMLFLLFLQGGIFLLWLIFIIISNMESKWQVLKDILVMNAIVFIVVNIFIIFDDLKYSAKSWSRFIFAGAIFFLLIIFVLLDVADIMSYPLHFNTSQPKSLAEVIIFNIICIGLFWWEFDIFQKRKSYLE
ncbi:MAG: hypothetical protein R6V04_05865 [bacterium]